MPISKTKKVNVGRNLLNQINFSLRFLEATCFGCDCYLLTEFDCL